MGLITSFKRWWYVRGMLNSIERARENTIYKNKMSRTDGLRVIKRFEKVNGITFNPFCAAHNEKIRGCANNESFFRAVKLAIN
jgi:hypothetical protein